jgi:hypothetical protein
MKAAAYHREGGESEMAASAIGVISENGGIG